MDNSISLYELSEQMKKENMLLNENEIKNKSEPLNYLKPLERLENNINAIKLLKKIENGYEIKDEDKNILLKYVGFGGISQVFDETNTGKWKEYREFLEQNLTTEEFDNAKESVLTAFYTPKIIIDYMYKGLEKLGFENGNILEPSLGIRNFIGNIPSSMNNSKFYGVELDTISGNIAKILYPNDDI